LQDDTTDRRLYPVARFSSSFVVAASTSVECEAKRALPSLQDCGYIEKDPVDLMEWPVNGHRGRPDASPNQAKTSAKNVADRLLEPSLAKSAQTADGVSAARLVD
jgi:hypothetical protein